MTSLEAQGRAFNRAIADFFGKLDKSRDELLRLFRKIVVELYESIVLLTPVDTGRARAGWRIEGGGVQGSGGGASIGSLPNASLIVFTILNAVPYIERLERGSSPQAPRGMVSPNLARFRAKIEAAAAVVLRGG